MAAKVDNKKCAGFFFFTMRDKFIVFVGCSPFFSKAIINILFEFSETPMFLGRGIKFFISYQALLLSVD